MRRTVIATGLLGVAISFAAASHPVHALSIETLLNEKPALVAAASSEPVSEASKPAAPVVEVATAPQPQPVTHQVAAGETLSSIADGYQTTWNRLYDKNFDIVDPNVIETSQVIVIPSPDEQLTPRPVASIPTAAATTVAPTPSARTVTARAQTVGAPRGSSAGNTYSYGYCTWYAKSRRPDLPNNLGNAATWVARAAAQGIATGSAPRAGAIGQQGGHVVYVESVNTNGTVTVSEMNYQGFNIISSRTVSAGSFLYIY